MKKHIILILLIVCLLLPTVLAKSEETPFDRRSALNFNRIYHITDLPIKFPELTAGEYEAYDHNLGLCIGIAWYNLYDYELKNDVRSQFKKVIDHLYSEEIYEAMKEGPGLVAFTAKTKDSSCINVFIAKNIETIGEVYWIECNIKEQSMKVMLQYGVEHYASDDEYLSDFVVNSLIQASIENWLDNYTPPEAVLKAYGITAFLDAANQTYALMNGDAPISF